MPGAATSTPEPRWTTATTPSRNKIRLQRTARAPAKRPLPDDPSTGDGPANASDAGADTSGESQIAAGGSDDHGFDADAGAAGSAVLGAQQTAQDVLAGLLTQAQAGSESAPTGPRHSAVKGLATANAAIDAETPVEGFGNGRPGGPAASQRAASSTHVAAQATVNASANASFNAAVNGEAAAATNTAAQVQAADLSKKVGAGNRVEVRVAVNDEAETLVSRPASSLAPSTVLAGEGAAKSQQAQAGTHGNTAAATGAAAQQAAQQGAAATPGQVQQGAAQAAQSQSAASAAAEVKGAATSLHSGNAQQTQAGSEASTSNTSAASQAAQAQKNAAAQTAKAQPANLPRQAVLDQVSVQITKALKAGVDKINIQLKPASLGRIEVRLELAQDGRVAAVITADNRDTLELLQRDAKSLERALLDAGLQADLGTMEFNLRGQGNEDEPAGDGAPSEDAAQAEEDDDDDADAAQAAYEGGITADGRVDIRA